MTELVDDASWNESSKDESTADETMADSKPEEEEDEEESYRMMSHIEHILLRPDTYVGSVEKQEEDMFVVEEDRIVKRTISYTPGLLKIFDEIIVNAADRKQRNPEMNKLDVRIDREANWISIRNNGKGMPVRFDEINNMYIPTLIFGRLLTGSNFNDKEKKTTGGRNGYGAKLTNVFSKLFQVECVDTKLEKYFQQTWRDNMSVAEEPVVKELTKKQIKDGDYVKVSFSPDLPRFKMDMLDKDIHGLFCRRAYDVAASLALCPGERVVVTVNGDKLPIKSFKDYIGCHEGVNKAVAFHKTERWEVGVGLAAQETHGSISFVNSIATTKGGKHVDYITDQIVNHLLTFLTKKKHNVTRSYIKNHLFVFANCLIENPAFDSQTKENLITTAKKFGSECKLADGFLKKVEKSDIVTEIIKYSQFQDQKKLKNQGGKKRARITGIPKLDDANWAGTAKSIECTLIITEGDSAKSLAMAGLSVVGRDRYGVFPLRGKPLNVRDSNQKQVTENEEIRNLVTILGLKFGTTYDESNIKTLRYGHLMIMADQDTDGSHIKGLVINMLHFFWPSLLDVSGFLKQFITPIVKASKGKNNVRTFFNLTEYEKWLESTGDNGRGWNIKYYKGLGTSTSVEAKDYFSNLDLHVINFANLSKDTIASEQTADAPQPEIVKSGNDMIDMVFRKTRVNDRRKWLEGTTTTETYLDYTTSTVKEEGVKFTDFIDKEYILFSVYDNVRSIPHIIDGFKPSQRKVLFGCFKRKLRGEVKVAQLTGYIAEHSSYHHGEASLQGTIVGMATSFLGSNNLNLLTPSGQFGTRRMGGKDAASPRYIYTKLEPVTRTIFHPDDDALLNYLNDDGNSIEPDFYVPVIPMILVNGCEGIGSGWSSSIPNHCPREIIANIRRLIAGGEMKPMAPHFHNFTGDIPEKGDNAYSVLGKIERVDDTTLVITELPIRTWTQTYKEFLTKMMMGDKKQPAVLLDFKENHTETTVHFTVSATKENIDQWEQEPGGLLKKFKLTGSLSTRNMVAFYEGKLTRFQSSNEILKLFFKVRSEFYVKRKARLVKNLSNEQRRLANKARFVQEVCTGALTISNRKKVEILSDLKEKGYEMFTDKMDKSAVSDEYSDGTNSEEEDHSIAELAKGFDYLLGLKIWALTFEKAEHLRAECETKKAELDALEATTPNQIWLKDLDAIEATLDDRDKAIALATQEEEEAREKLKYIEAKANEKKGRRKTTKKRKGTPKTPPDIVPVSGSDDDSNAKGTEEPPSKKPRVSASPQSTCSD